jgi:hypothetical protein
MIETVDRLVRGDAKLLPYYQKVASKWQEMLAREGGRDPNKLAEMLTQAQGQLELECDMDRRLVREIIAVVGIGRLYELGAGFRGHEGDLHLVRLAIQRSGCSLDVKYAAKRVAEFYGLPT